MKAWGGIASLQLGLPAVWTGARSRGLSLSDVARWMCEAPARLIGLAERKGSIRAGCDADLVVWDPDRNKITPYQGRSLQGVVEATYLRGEKVFARSSDLFQAPPRGRLLSRGTS